MSIRKLLLTGLVIAAAGVAGCGGSDDDSEPSQADAVEAQSVLDAANQSIEAIDSRNAKQLCALIAPAEIKKQFKSQKDCVQGFQKLLRQGKQESNRKIGDVTVDGDQAKVELLDAEGADQGEAMFVNVGGKWYLTLSGGPQKPASTDEAQPDDAS